MKVFIKLLPVFFCAGFTFAQIQTPMEVIAEWEKMWDTYDLSMVARLFVNDHTVTYFSSERNERITGIDSLMAHHARFGFVDGGKKTGNKLWLSDVLYTGFANGSVVTAFWHFSRNQGSSAQSGPVTFILTHEKDGYRIQHAHFSNHPR